MCRLPGLAGWLVGSFTVLVGTVAVGCGQGSPHADPGGAGGAGTAGGTGGVFHASLLQRLIPDVDDDDQNHQVDWLAPLSNPNNEIVPLQLPDALLDGMAADHRLELTLDGDLDHVVVALNGQGLLGHIGTGKGVATVELSGEDARGAFRVGCGSFHRKATLLARHLDASGTELATVTLELLGAPLVLNHHLQVAERVWAVKDADNGALTKLLQTLLGTRFVLVNNPDIWIQDELEWATATAPNQRLDVAMDSIRDRQLDTYVKGLKAPDVQPLTWGVDGNGTTEDKFGNLETTPPVKVGGIQYPLGRIYYGDNGVVGPNATLKDFLDAQQVQAPIRVDTSWLCVGHVDEFITFVADPSSPKGFKLLFADVPAAYTLLANMDPATALPRYSSAHGYATVGAILADKALQALNDDLQNDNLTPILDDLKQKLGLDEDDVVRVPALFERIPDCAYSSAFLEVAALVPAMVNLVVVQVEGAPPRLIVPDPFFRPAGAALSEDPFAHAFQAGVPSTYEIHFVDDWYAYHVSMGEVHCGTNVQRTPVLTTEWRASRAVPPPIPSGLSVPGLPVAPADAPLSPSTDEADPRAPSPVEVPRRTRAGGLRFNAPLVHDHPALAAELLRRLSVEPSPELRAALVSALPRTGGAFFDGVLAHFAREPEPGVRRAIASILPRAPRDRRAAGMMQGLGDRDARVRAEAALAAGTLAPQVPGVDAVLGRLASLLDDSDAQVRASAVRSLGLLGGDPRLVARRHDPAPAVRLEAVRALGRLARGSSTVLQPLRSWGHDPDLKVSRAVRRFLERP